MDIFHFRQTESNAPHNTVLTIGNFDGVHLGHQALIRQVVQEAAEMGVKSALMTFQPHPQAVLRGAPVPMLTSLPLRLRLFEELGLDSAYLIPFTREFAAKPPQAFMEEFLLNTFKVRKLIIGFDFQFGRDREGSSRLLRAFSQAHGFGFEIFPEVSLNGEKVSSTRIRAALERGDFPAAHHFLGRPFSVLEEVMRGDQRGRLLGFPTVNQHPEAPLPIGYGVYAARAVVDGVAHQGVANYGVRPTFGASRPVLETHLFDFSADIYGQLVEVIPVRRLRGEQRFPNAEALQAQIAADLESARQALGGE